MMHYLSLVGPHNTPVGLTAADMGLAAIAAALTMIAAGTFCSRATLATTEMMAGASRPHATTHECHPCGDKGVEQGDQPYRRRVIHGCCK